MTPPMPLVMRRMQLHVNQIGMTRRGRALVAAVLGSVLAFLSPTGARAQSASGTDSARINGPTANAEARAVIARARALVDAGKGAASRALLDSLVIASANEPGDLADGLYWRAVLGERAADAERDWKRIIVDVPLSPRVPTALLRLGELEMVRGHPAGARTYLERLLRDYSGVSERPKATLWIVRSYFDERDLTRACRALSGMQAATLPAGELQLQAEELQARCARETAVGGRAAAAPKTAEVAPSKPQPPTPIAPVERTGSERAPAPESTSARSAAGSGTGRFSVQIAAFDTQEQAESTVKRLQARGLDAHNDSDAAPYRVRVGYYETRAEATAALARLQKQGQKGFVVVLTP